MKCDEAHPRCGPCTRLNKDCKYGRQWRFQDCGPRVQRKYDVVGPSNHSELARLFPSSDDRTFLPLESVERTLPPFAKLPDDEYREQKALTRPPGTYHVVLTPDSFSRLPEYGDLVRKGSTAPSSRSKLTSDDSEDDPDVIILSEFENTPYVKLTTTSSDSFLYRDSGSANVVFQVSYVPEIQRDFADYGTRADDNTRHLMLYQKSVCKRIMPLGTRFELNLGAGNEDVILAFAKHFRPLYHAICSITLLSLALGGQPNLLAGAFQHYDQAISACLSYTDIDSDEFFYLHFLLLLYDICCATQSWPQDNRMWAQHLEHLSRMIHKKRHQSVGRLQAYISWYVLLLDSHSCLAANKEAGSYVRAYLENNCTLPKWPLSPTANQKALLNEESDTFMAVHGLTLHMFTASAKMSQLALALRENARQSPTLASERQEQTETFCEQLRTEWLERCPPSMRPGSNISEKPLPTIVSSTFEFAQLQYSGIAIYLHTSMYPGQRLYSNHYREEDAHHCSFILSMASKAVANRDFGNHHMVPAIFIAGFASMSPKDKYMAMELLRAFEGTGISRSVTRSRELLQYVLREQSKRQEAGGHAEEVDWIDVAREKGIKCINFGL